MVLLLESRCEYLLDYPTLRASVDQACSVSDARIRSLAAFDRDTIPETIVRPPSLPESAMSAHSDRRLFLQSAALGVGGLAFLDGLPAVAADDAKVNPNLVRLDSDIEPLVRLLEETPRERLLEEVGSRVKKGLPYRDVLAALLLAGVRNIQPRPNVGFKFHAVLVVNSAHLASLAGPDQERWLPIFWALDQFKSAQATNEKESGWRMKSVDESQIPTARKTREMFVEAMTAWDEPKADVAAAALARHSTANEAFDLFARFGCRDFRDIGHKAIFVANAFRTLQVIGWQHAEAVFRSLAFALLKRETKEAPTGDAVADRVGFRNIELARKIGTAWRDGKPNPKITDELLALLRQGSDAEAGEKVVSLLNGGTSPQVVWDAVFLGAGELLMRQPGIVGLHTLTTANALRYAFETVGDDETRKLLLLQATSFLPLFRGAMNERGKVDTVRIDQLEAPDDPGKCTVESIFQTLNADKMAAARMTIAYLAGNPNGGRSLIDAGRLLVALKGTDAHDYKFSTAIMEDYGHISPERRNSFLAASMFWLKGSSGPDSPLVKRIRASLA